MKRMICLALLLTLCLASVAVAEDVQYPMDGSHQLTWWLPMESNLVTVLSTYNDHPVYQKLMENTGVDIEFTHPAVGQEKEEFGLLLVSGDLPDIIQSGNLSNYYTGGVQAAYDDGIIIDLTELVREYAPDYYATISADEKTWREFTNNDRILAFYTYWEEVNPLAICLALRQDWLDEFGMKAEDMTTYDAIEGYFQAILDNKPGVEPLYLNVSNNIYYYGHNIHPGWYQVNDQVVYYDSGEQANYRGWLEQMHDWYAKGFISVDFASYTASDARAHFSAGLVGCFAEPIGNIYSDAEASGLPVSRSPFWRQQEGDIINVYFPSGLERNGGQDTVITTACEDPITAVKLLNYGYTEAGKMLTNYGIEDASYTLDADGKPQYTDLVLNNENYGTSVTHLLYRIHWIGNRKLADTTCNPNITKNEKVTADRLLYTDLTDSFNGDYILPKGVSLTTEENAERSTIMSNVETYVKEMRLKFITGAVALDDANWEAYLSSLESYGLSRAMEITQAAYDRYMGK